MSSGSASSHSDLREVFQTIDDWRVRRTQRHDLADILRNGQIVGGDYHGHVRTFDQLSQSMKNTLGENGITVGKGGTIKLDKTMWGD